MTDWRSRLLQASFRGVPFFVAGAAEAQVGRRVAVHEFPNRDLAYGEDMGRALHTFSLEAFVVGPDYMKARAELIVALEPDIPGGLVHPDLGGDFRAFLEKIV